MSDIKPFTVSRIFNAPRALVYKVNTESEHLAKWMGPAGAKVIKTDLRFEVGGIHHYGLELPDGSQMWGKQVYLEIVPLTRIVLIQSFSDKDAGLTRHPMAPTWPLEMLSTTTFADDGSKTIMTVNWKPYNSDATGIATFDGARDGMTGGFKGMMDTLETYLVSLK